jgi:hypothetical protein
MDIFYIIVLSIATIVLILILTYIGIQMTNKQTSSSTFPPTSSTCPDYWSLASDGKSCLVKTTGRNAVGGEYQSSNVKSGYNSGLSSIDFTDPGWSADGKSAVCAQKTWADSEKISWDGVTNYNKC